MSKQDLRALRITSEEDLEGLDEADIRWLLERDRIPTELKGELLEQGSLTEVLYPSVPMSERANTGDVRTMSTDELEKELERRRAEAEDNPNAEGDDPHFEDEDDEEDDEDDEPRTTKKAPAKKAAKKVTKAAKKAPASESSDDDDDDDDDEDDES